MRQDGLDGMRSEESETEREGCKREQQQRERERENEREKKPQTAWEGDRLSVSVSGWVAEKGPQFIHSFIACPADQISFILSHSFIGSFLPSFFYSLLSHALRHTCTALGLRNTGHRAFQTHSQIVVSFPIHVHPGRI